MKRDEILHVTRFPWIFVENNRVAVTLRLGKEESYNVEVWYCDPCDYSLAEQKKPAYEYCTLHRTFEDADYAYFKAEMIMKTHKLRYHFKVFSKEKAIYYGETGLSCSEEEIRPFLVPYTWENEQCQRPRWAEKMNWYQIFPDRFSREEDELIEQFRPQRENFYGGTLRGICKKIPYLKEIGVDGIYLNPVFASVSNHRYDTSDYMSVDAMLGNREELKALADTCHQNRMRVMLDGVFNHCGADSFIWQDVVRKGKKSRYYDWFFIYDENALSEELAVLSSERMKSNPPYESFAFAANMPKWNTANQETADYLISAAEYWTVYLELDAWRLDVPDEVSMTFLRTFYRRIKKINPQIYIIGEIWQDADRWFEQAVFDGVMDYPFYFAVRDFFLRGTLSAFEFCNHMACHTLVLPESIQRSNFHFLSNHDIPRALTIAGNNEEAFRNAYLFIAVFCESISLFYGDEVGVKGGDDPECRGTFPWNHINEELLKWFRTLLHERKKWKQEKINKALIPINEEQILVQIDGESRHIELVFERGGKLISAKGLEGLSH